MPYLSESFSVSQCFITFANTAVFKENQVGNTSDHSVAILYTFLYMYIQSAVYIYIICMKNLRYHFPKMLYAYSVKEPIGELNLKRALDEDTGVHMYICTM